MAMDELDLSKYSLGWNDGDEFVLSFLGAVYAGVVPVPIYPQLSFKNVDTYHDTVAHIAKASGASMLLTTTATRPYVDPVLPRVDNLRFGKGSTCWTRFPTFMNG